MHYFSPLRYPGGKGKLAAFVKKLFRHNNLCDGVYVEPYAGGAAVALSLLLEGYAWNIVINDLDPKIYAFWWTLLNDTETLLRKITDTKVSIPEWRRQKAIYENAENHSRTEVGFATFFLNRTNRSGILKAGVIGGLKQNGPYKLDARFNKKDLVERINLIAMYGGRIELHNLDAWDLVTSLAPTLPEKSLIYFDPPYFGKGKLLYSNYYSLPDHERMAVLIRSLSCSWIVTYDNVSEIKDLYRDQQSAEFDISYSAHLTRTRGAEVMFYRNLELPSLPHTRKADLN